MRASTARSNASTDGRHIFSSPREHKNNSGGQRVLKTASPALNSVYIFDSLELRGAAWANGDYTQDLATTSLRLLAGPITARIVYDTAAQLPGSRQHIFMEFGDHLGSNSFTIDKGTGELVEYTTYQSYGAVESSYRPGRWGSFREPYKFTGKEEDIEVGLVYFGFRYLNPLLQRWISADPLAIHDPGSGDLNVYAYVNGRVLNLTDPMGLEPGLFDAAMHVVGDVVLYLGGGGQPICQGGGECGAHHVSDGEYVARIAVVAASGGLGGAVAKRVGVLAGGAIAGGVGAVSATAVDDVATDTHTRPSGYAKNAVVGATVGAATAGVAAGAGKIARRASTWLDDYMASQGVQPSKPPSYVPKDSAGNPLALPKGKNGELAPYSMDPHTQIGLQGGRKGPYVATREFGPNGKPVKQVDWGDHGRPKVHTNPHVHDYIPNPTGGTPQHGKARAPRPGEL